MKRVCIWNNINNPNLIKYYIDIVQIINFIKENKIMNFLILDDNGLSEDKKPTEFTQKYNEQAEKSDKEIIYFDYDHPAFVDGYGNLCISKDFYLRYEDEIKKAIEEVLYSSDYAHVNKYMYSDELAKLLVINAKTIRFEKGIKIPDDINILYKNNHINAYVEDEKQISSNNILGFRYEDVVSNSEYITIKDNISDLQNLIYIPDYKEITIQPSIDDEVEEDYDKMYEIISTLRKNGQNNKITIEVKNRNKFYKSKLHNSNFDIIIKGLDYDPYTLAELKKEDELIDKIVEEIKNGNSSPLEKYIACYNIDKRFKEYKESNNAEESRRLRLLLNNDYMVCVGYTNLLEILSNRVGFNIYQISVSIDTSYDNGFTMEKMPISLEGHARVIVNIEDPKYNIHGFYVSDPTWDNDLEEDYYNHVLMSFDKTTKEERYFKLEIEDLIMNVRSMEEFSCKINFLLNKERKSNNAVDLSDKEKESYAYGTIISYIMRILSYLMPQKYIELKHKYPNAIKFKNDYDEANKFLTEAGYIFINNLGNDVSIDTIIDAASEVNKKVFGFKEKYNNENFYEYKMDLLEKNSIRDKKQFPYYYSDTKTFLNEHLEDVINIFKESFKELPDAIEKLSEEKKQEIKNDNRIKDFLSSNPEAAFKYEGSFIFAKIIHDVLPDTKFVVERTNIENMPFRIVLRNDKVCFDISYEEEKKDALLKSNLEYHDAMVSELLSAEERFYNPPGDVYNLLESIFRSNLRNYLSIEMNFENENKYKHN